MNSFLVSTAKYYFSVNINQFIQTELPTLQLANSDKESSSNMMLLF
jgi:hypothetical protein